MNLKTTGLAALFCGLVACSTEAPPSVASSANRIPAASDNLAVTRAAFLKLIDRPKVPAAAEVHELGETGGVQHANFTYASEAGSRVPGIWAKPAGNTARLPVVIMLHGTGGKKEDMKEQMEKYAQAGFFAVAIDGPFHGERASPGAKSADYELAVLQAWRTGQGHPFFYDTVWDVMRLVDYLQKRDDVDPQRIGLMGVSKGGIETYLTAAVDPRIAAAVPFIGLESFRWALDHDVWSHRTETIQTAIDGAAKDLGVTKVDADFVRKFYDRVAPGIYGQFDGPAMLPLVAPRPLLAVNGEIDPRTPIAGIQECLDAAQPLYHAANADAALKLFEQPNTPHRVTPEGYQAGLDWFKQWLKPDAK
jgi:dienelactone hydrolase